MVDQAPSATHEKEQANNWESLQQLMSEKRVETGSVFDVLRAFDWGVDITEEGLSDIAVILTDEKALEQRGCAKQFAFRPNSVNDSVNLQYSIIAKNGSELESIHSAVLDHVNSMNFEWVGSGNEGNMVFTSNAGEILRIPTTYPSIHQLPSAWRG